MLLYWVAQILGAIVSGHIFIMLRGTASSASFFVLTTDLGLILTTDLGLFLTADLGLILTADLGKRKQPQKCLSVF